MSTATSHIEKKKTLIPQLRFQEFDGEWETNKLSDWKLKVIDGDRGTNYPNGDDFSSEGYCLFMNAKNVTKNGFSFETTMFITKEKDEKLRKGKLKRNDLILTTRGSVGNIAFYDDTIKFENLRINSGMVLIRNENSKIDSRFIYSSFFTPKLNRIIDTISFGSAQPQLTVKEINLFKFNIPTLSEQQKIASFLNVVDEKVQQLSRKKELLEQYKKGVMQQLFSGKLRFKDQNGKDYPDWEEKKLGDLGVFKGGGTPSTEISEYWDGDIPWISSSDLIENDISNINITRFITEKAITESATKLIPVNSVLFISRVGVGKLAVSKRIMCTSQDFANFIPNEIDSYFLAYYFLKHNNILISYAQGTSIKGFTSGDLKSIKVSYPVVEEQQKIANFLSGVDGKIEQVNGELLKTQEFKKGLLQQMFV